MRLARTLPAQLLPIHAPHPPDFYVCSTTYGTNIVPWDCQFNVDTYWRSGATPVHYYFSKPVPSNAIPLPFITSTFGWDSSCQIAIEPAGPNYGSLPYLAFSPDKLRGLAGYVIQKCAQEGNGKGGFVTVGLDGAEHYLQNWVDAKDQGIEKNASGMFRLRSPRVCSSLLLIFTSFLSCSHFRILFLNVDTLIVFPTILSLF